MRYFDAFAGMGGFALALGPEHECVGYSEIEPNAIKIYEKNFPKHKNFGDITTIKASGLPDFDLFVGGFPCQSFSVAGKRKGFDDTRGTLFFDICRIVKEKRPKYLLLENVKGLLSHDNGRTYKIILSSLAELGYDTEALVFDSYLFNAAPRPRVYIFAMHREQTSDILQRAEQARSLYNTLLARTGIKDEGWAETCRTSGRIIRAFTKLPDWLDDWSVLYPEEKSGR